MGSVEVPDSDVADSRFNLGLIAVEWKDVGGGALKDGVC